MRIFTKLLLIGIILFFTSSCKERLNLKDEETKDLYEIGVNVIQNASEYQIHTQKKEDDLITNVDVINYGDYSEYTERNPQYQKFYKDSTLYFFSILEEYKIKYEYNEDLLKSNEKFNNSIDYLNVFLSDKYVKQIVGEKWLSPTSEKIITVHLDHNQLFQDHIIDKEVNVVLILYFKADNNLDRIQLNFLNNLNYEYNTINFYISNNLHFPADFDQYQTNK